MTLSPPAARIYAGLRATGRRRVDLATITRLHRETEPHASVQAGSRARLLELIEELRSHGALRLPRGSRQYDRRELPHLPAWVGLTEPEEKAEPAPHASRRHPWPPALRWAATLHPPPSATDMEALIAVAEFLTGGGAMRAVVPVKERSLELFEDEKRLDGLARGRLFAPGRLSLELLRCLRTPPPFVWTPLGSPPTMLVVENSATYWTFRRLLGGGSPVGVLAYGAGTLFTRSVASAAELGPRRPRRILYFGDVDGRGITIPWAASTEAERAGLPAVEPAVPLYARLLRRPARPAVKGGGDARGLDWLPPPMRETVAKLLEARLRIAQESLGYEALADDEGWRLELAAQLGTPGVAPTT